MFISVVLFTWLHVIYILYYMYIYMHMHMYIQYIYTTTGFATIDDAIHHDAVAEEPPFVSWFQPPLPL